MIDVNIEAENALKKIDCIIQYQYPQSFFKLPVITYYTLEEGMGMTADNEEIIQDASVQVDIWSSKPAECGSLAVKVNDAMNSEGWNREFSMDQRRQQDENVYHKTMRFKKSFII